MGHLVSAQAGVGPAHGFGMVMREGFTIKFTPQASYELEPKTYTAK